MTLESIAAVQGLKNSFLFYLSDRDIGALGCTSHKMKDVAAREMQRRDAALRELLSPFTLYRKFNIEDPVRARLFGLGERHGAAQNIIDRSRIIFHLSLRGPVILLIEGITFLEKCNYFFEKRWVAAGISEKLSVFIHTGDPFLAKNLLGFGWDCHQDDAEAREHEERERIETIAIEQAVTFPNLLDSSMKELFQRLEKVYWRVDPASLLIPFRIEGYNRTLKIMEGYILRSPSFYAMAAVEYPNIAELFESWESTRGIAEHILSSGASEETLLARPEILEVLHQAANLFTLVPDPLLYQQWKEVLGRNGIFYQNSGEISDDALLCPGFFTDPLSKRLLEAFEGIQVHFDLLKHFIALYGNNLKSRDFGKEAHENQNYDEKPTSPKTDSSGCLGIYQNDTTLEPVYFQEHKKFFDLWNKNFQQFEEIISQSSDDRIFPYRTVAMIYSIKQVRAMLGLLPHNSFIVVQAGANHLKSRKERENSFCFDLTPLYKELSQHEAVILTHSDTF